MNTATRPDAKDPLNLTSLEPLARRGGFRLRHVMYAVLYCALICWLGVMTGLILISGFLGLILAIVCVVVYVFAGRRSTQQDALLWALAVTAAREMPMAPTFDAFSSQCWGEYRRKVLAGARHLRQGLSLPEVLVREPGLFPRDAEVLIRAGHDCATLGRPSREAAALRARLRVPWMGVAVRLAYLLWVLVVFQAIAGFMIFFILPKFEAIFSDFGVPLPAVTILSIDVSHFFMNYIFLFLPLFVIQLGLLGLVHRFSPGRAPLGPAARWPHLLPPAHGARTQVPGTRCGRKPTHGTRDPDAGAYLSGGGDPAPGSSGSLATSKRATTGASALLARGLIRPPEASLLEAAKRLGNLSWALRQAAENSERRLAYRVQLCAQWLVPLFVVAIGAIVFMMAMAYFTPLLVLIEKLAS